MDRLSLPFSSPIMQVCKVNKKFPLITIFGPYANTSYDRLQVGAVQLDSSPFMVLGYP